MATEFPTARMQYDYSTKNFHRYTAVGGFAVVKEIYIPRTYLETPIAEITVSIQVAAYVPVAERKRETQR